MMGDFLQSETADRQEELTPVTDTPPSAEQKIIGAALAAPTTWPVLTGSELVIKALTAAGKIIVDKEHIEAAANAIERLAFEMPPPNTYTPRFVEFAIALRAMTQPKDTDYE